MKQKIFRVKIHETQFSDWCLLLFMTHCAF